MSQRVAIGDVLAIPLPNGGFAYCRIHKDASIGVYDHVSEIAHNLPPDECRYNFVVPVYRDLLTSGAWPKVGHKPFANEEDAWPPPYIVRDAISGKVSIYHRGSMRPALSTDSIDMEEAAIWDQYDVVARIASG